MNIGLSGGGFTALFYAVSIMVMFIRELLFFAARRSVTAELRLAFEQMFYLVTSMSSIVVLYILLKYALLAHPAPAPGSGVTFYVQQFTYVLVNHALLIALCTFFLVWASIAFFTYTKGVLSKSRPRIFLRPDTL